MPALKHPPQPVPAQRKVLLDSPRSVRGGFNCEAGTSSRHRRRRKYSPSLRPVLHANPATGRSKVDVAGAARHRETGRESLDGRRESFFVSGFGRINEATVTTLVPSAGPWMWQSCGGLECLGTSGLVLLRLAVLRTLVPVLEVGLRQLL